MKLLEAWILVWTLQKTIEATEAKLKAEVEVVEFLLKTFKTNIQSTAEDLAIQEGHDNNLELLETWTLQKTIEATEAKLKADKSRFETLTKKHNLKAPS